MLLTLLHKLDSAGTSTILQCIVDSNASTTEKDEVKEAQAMQTWRALHFTPTIVAALNTAGVNSDVTLSMYHNDIHRMRQLQGVLSTKESSLENKGKSNNGFTNCLWTQKLALWSTI